MRKFILICLLTMLPAGAWAQCTGGLINNCPKAVSPQAGDFVLGWQNSQSPHTRAPTNAQVVQGALQQPLTTKLTALTSGPSGAGFNLGIGAAPTPCTPGDLWMTGTGTFDCHAGAPFQLGTGGGGGTAFVTYANAGALPAVTAANAGQNAYVLNCQNGSQGALAGTGCYYNVNAVGVWVANPSPSNLTVTIGGQAIYLGGATNNQGNGTKLQLANGGFTAGNALIYDASGNAVDAGVPPSGGTGGSGTVTSAAVNSIPFYSASPTGSTLAGLAKVPNSVIATNSSGVPSETTTLPPGLIIQSPTISGPTITGTTSLAVTNMTGKLTTVASTTAAAGLNLAQGVAPTSPVNGDLWETSNAIVARINGTTQTLISGIAVLTPIVGALNGGIESLSCPTCATLTIGGTLTGSSPITVGSTGLVSLGLQPAPIVWIADSATAVHNDTYNLIEKSPWANNVTVNSITYHTGGTNTPSFTASLRINGAPVTGCNGIGVSSSTDATATCTAANTLGNLGTLSLVISGTSGSPVSAVVQVNVSKPAS
jgi:hypothetical protein